MANCDYQNKQTYNLRLMTLIENKRYSSATDSPLQKPLQCFVILSEGPIDFPAGQVLTVAVCLSGWVANHYITLQEADQILLIRKSARDH